MVSVASLTSRSARTPVSFVKYDWVLPDTLMGVEVEVDSDHTAESSHPEPYNLVSWNRHHDGSLVNGFEYTLKSPMEGALLSKAISELFAPPSDFHRTFTGSTHIHIDMLGADVTLDVLRTMVLLVYTLEPALYAAGDSSREWCGYSNSLKSADPTLLSTLFADDVTSKFTRTYRRGSMLGRYYGLNLTALTDYGSLEFRYFPTATNAEELVNWINLVQSFKKAALAIGTPSALKEVINDQASYDDMISSYFPAYVSLINSTVDWRQVHSMFTKANVVMNDSKLTAFSVFDGAKVFESSRFSSLVTVRPVTEAPPAKIHATGNIPSDPQDGEVLVYHGRVYIRHDYAWLVVSDTQRHRVELSAATLSALGVVLREHAAAYDHDLSSCSRIIDLGYIPSWDDGSSVPEEEDDYSLEFNDEEDDEF